MKRLLLLAAALVVGGVLWLLSRREPARIGDRQEPEARAQAPADEVALEPPQAAEKPRDQPVRAPADDPVSSVDDEPAPPGAEEAGVERFFHGQVFDALAGRPLAGVRAVVPQAKRGARPDELAAEEISREDVSDGEGRFALPLAAQHGVELGYLLADGYGSVSFMVDTEHGSRAAALVLELLPVAELEVEVTDVGGGPVQASKVELVKPSENLLRANAMMSTPALSWIEHTDQEGRVRFGGLPAEIELAWTVLPGAEPHGRAGRLALAPGEQRRLTVMLGSDPRVIGHVRDERGEPVAGLDLWLVQADAADGRPKEAVAKARSDENGRFELAGVPFETFVLGPAPGVQDFVARGHEVVVVDRPLVEHDLEVERGLFLSGCVTGSTAEIDELAFLSVQRLDGTWVDGGMLDGASFRIGPLAAGEYLLSGSGGERATAIVRVTAGASDVELPLLEPHELRLSIQGSGGPFELRVRDVSRGPTWMWTQNDALSVLPLVPGSYTLLVNAPGELVGFMAFELREGVPLEELVVRLEPGARYTFVHRASEGARMLRVFVDGAPYMSDYQSEFALAAGAARTLLVPPRSLVAELYEGIRAVAHQEFTPVPGERLRVELVPR